MKVSYRRVHENPARTITRALRHDSASAGRERPLPGAPAVQRASRLIQTQGLCFATSLARNRYRVGTATLLRGSANTEFGLRRFPAFQAQLGSNSPRGLDHELHVLPQINRQLIGYVPPVAYEEAFYRRQVAQNLLAALT